MACSSRAPRAPHPQSRVRLISFVACTLLSFASLPGPAEGLAGEAELQKARRAAQSLTDQLRERIDSRMKEAGPGAALKVCIYQVQGISRDLEQTQGVVVKRVSNKARNPMNAPDAWERAVLEKYVGAEGQGWGMEEVFERVEGEMGAKGTWRYARPILMQKGCLVCHGTSSDMPAEVVDGLRDKYPTDPAKGYRTGDLHGIVSVRFSE